jgi:hypothetical protein
MRGIEGRHYETAKAALVGARASGHFPFVIQHGSHVIVLAAFVYHTEAAAFLAPGGDT